MTADANDYVFRCAFHGHYEPISNATVYRVVDRQLDDSRVLVRFVAYCGEWCASEAGRRDALDIGG